VPGRLIRIWLAATSRSVFFSFGAHAHLPATSLLRSFQLDQDHQPKQQKNVKRQASSVKRQAISVKRERDRQAEREKRMLRIVYVGLTFRHQIDFVVEQDVQGPLRRRHGVVQHLNGAAVAPLTFRQRVGSRIVEQVKHLMEETVLAVVVVVVIISVVVIDGGLVAASIVAVV